MADPKVGTQVLCSACGEAIEWRGEYWDHLGEHKPRHPAIPASFKVAPSQPSYWRQFLDPRELAQVEHAIVYAKDHAAAGVPGHGQFLLIAKLAAALDEATRND